MSWHLFLNSELTRLTINFTGKLCSDLTYFLGEGYRLISEEFRSNPYLFSIFNFKAKSTCNTFKTIKKEKLHFVFSENLVYRAICN